MSVDGRTNRHLSVNTESDDGLEDDEERLRRLLAEDSDEEEITFAPTTAETEAADPTDETISALMDLLHAPLPAVTEADSRDDILEWAHESDDLKPEPRTASQPLIVSSQSLDFSLQQEDTEEASPDFNIVQGSYEIGGELIEVIA